MLKSRTWAKSVFGEIYEESAEGICPRPVNYDAFLLQLFPMKHIVPPIGLQTLNLQVL